MKRNEKIRLAIYTILQLSIIIAGIIAIWDREWMNLAFAVFTLFIVNLPSIYERRFKIDIPDDFEVVLVIFIYAALFLGELNEFYFRFWWWDKVLHGVSGLIFGNMGYLIVSYLNQEKKLNVELTPFFVALFSFCFAVTIGAVWEIYEYAMDKFFGFFMQRGSLDDTMIDLILDTLGALVFAVLGYFEEKGKINIVAKFLGRYEDQEDLFAK
ncbi:MAG: hypothetical protein GX058_05715 [Firmicutes bacterium]|nr:hypothetical protein [Bacillota bacterium]